MAQVTIEKVRAVTAPGFPPCLAGCARDISRLEALVSEAR
jgi:hypothetical protein